MTQPPGDFDRSSLRASDQDRERAADILRGAAGDGRLSMTELDERLDAVYAAKTYADLEPIIRDLPHEGIAADKAMIPATPPASTVDRFGGQPTSSSAIAIMGGFSRKGTWVVPASFTAVAIMGGGEIDLREARFSEHVVNIHAVAIMGGMEITVPDDAEVEVTGIGLMGGFEHGATGSGRPGGPRIHINGLAFWGGIGVKRKPPKGQKKRQKLQAKQETPELGSADSEDH